MRGEGCYEVETVDLAGRRYLSRERIKGREAEGQIRQRLKSRCIELVSFAC